MWVEKQNGKFKFSERYIEPVTGKRRKASVTMEKHTRQTEKLAREALRQKIQSRTQPLKEEYTIRQLADLYLADLERTVKMSTMTRNRSALNTLCSIMDADTPVARLNAGYIRQRLLGTGEPAGRLNERLKRFKAFLRWCYQNDYIEDVGYIKKLKPFPDVPRRRKIEDKFLESAELQLLLDAMGNIKWYDLTKFLALSGLRIGEAAALLREDVSLSDREIHVTKNYDSNNDIVTKPKTYTSSRDVYMQDELFELCGDILAKTYIETNVIKINRDRLLFTMPDGERLSYNAYRKYLREVSARALGRKITPHVLRHTHASLMMEAGMSVDAISARLGHSDSKITKDIYLHVTGKLKDKRNKEIEKVRLFAP